MHRIIGGDETAGNWSSVRILQVHNSYLQRGGEDTVVEGEAALLRAAGHEVTQHLTVNPSTFVGASASLAVSTWNPTTPAAIRDVVSASQPDVAHVHNTWYRVSPSILRALHRCGVPTVMTVHNYRFSCINGSLYRAGAPCTDCVDSHPWRGVANRCYRDSFATSAIAASALAINRGLGTYQKYVDRFIVATDYLGEMLVRLGIPEDRIRLLPLSTPDPGLRSNPPSDSNVVLFVSRIDPEKGARELLDVWGEAQPSLRLRVIGDGSDRAELEALDVPNVEFLGWLGQEEVRREMLSARALAFPSIMVETFGLSLAEAFAAGLPAVANDLGIRRSIVGTEGAGWLAPDRDGWLQALATLESDEAVDKAGVIARQRYERNFNPDVRLPRLVEIYEELRASPRSA